MYSHKNIFILSFSCLFYMSMASCVSKKALYLDGQEDLSPVSHAAVDIEHTLFLIGDSGGAPMGVSTPALTYLEKELINVKGNSSIIFLGDNIYPVGVPPVGSEDRPLADHRLEKQLEILDTYEGKIIFLPGNHDWYSYGREGIQRQEVIIEHYLNNRNITVDQNNFFLPDNGCGEPHVVELAPGLKSLVFDSHWFLNAALKPYSFGDCKVKTRKEFMNRLEDLVEKHQGEIQVLAMHHPLYTYGPHGGGYTFSDIVFPVSQINEKYKLFLPLSGLIVKIMKGYISEQDVQHRDAKLMKNNLLRILDKNGPTIIAGGHEHTLQHIENDSNVYIVSGAGSKNNPVGLGEGSFFSTGENGFVKVEFLKNKSVVFNYIVPDKEGKTAIILYQRVREL